MSVDTAFDDADLNGFVDGRIDPSRAAALAESLSSDPQARARVDGWKRQNESLRTMFASVLFEPLPVRLLPGTMPARQPTPETAKPREGAEPIRGRLLGVIATMSAGMALVGFAVGALVGINTDGFGLSHDGGAEGRGSRLLQAAPDRPLVERATEAHRTFIGDPIRPVELTAAEEPRLARWIQHRLGASVRIPDLTRQGWGFVGGRIVPGPHGPAAFLVYGDGPERLGLTVARSAAATPSGMVVGDRSDPIGSASWAEDGFGYALTSDRGADWLERNAGALRDSVHGQSDGFARLP